MLQWGPAVGGACGGICVVGQVECIEYCIKTQDTEGVDLIILLLALVAGHWPLAEHWPLHNCIRTGMILVPVRIVLIQSRPLPGISPAWACLRIRHHSPLLGPG